MSQNRPQSRWPRAGSFRVAACVSVLLSVGWHATQVVAQEAEEGPDRYKTVLDLAFTTTSGNQSVTLLTSDLGFTHLDPTAYRLEAKAGARFGRSDGETVAENYKGQLDFAFTPDADWSPFLFAELEHDPFRRLDVRSNSGGGARLRFWKSDRGEASISGAVLYSYENFAPESGASELRFVATEQHARLSWRGRIERDLSENVALEHTTFYQPVWDAFDDYLLDALTTVRVRVNSAIALTTAFRYLRDATPPSGVGRDDRLLTAGVSIEL
ncbi:MAG: DUF481 domain-containing protein [Gemmatimonadota bacterium]